MEYKGIWWTTETKHVDIDTGEEITKHRAKKEYKLIKTTKYGTEINTNKTKGKRIYILEYRRDSQGKLPFD